MAKYSPPEQSKAMQFVDIIFLLIAIFAALWLPLKMGFAGAAKSIDAIENPTWELLKQTPGQVAQWEKLGYDPVKAHDVIQNHFHYDINWGTLLLMAAVLIAYFVFLFRASDTEYREVIDEKFGNGK
jgi:small-conductance mechanosensitive channel